MRIYFKSKESHSKQLVKDRLRKRHKRRIQRAKILRDLKPEIDRISASSKLAELLATQVLPKSPESTGRFEISESEISTKLIIHNLKKGLD